jgi:hypothetical protein
MIEKFMRDHPLVSFVVIPCAVIGLAGVFMTAIIFTINSAVS